MISTRDRSKGLAEKSLGVSIFCVFLLVAEGKQKRCRFSRYMSFALPFLVIFYKSFCELSYKVHVLLYIQCVYICM